MEEDLKIKYSQKEYELEYKKQCNLDQEKQQIEVKLKQIDIQHKNALDKLIVKNKTEMEQSKIKLKVLEEENMRMKEQYKTMLELSKKKSEKDFIAKIESLTRKLRFMEDKQEKVKKQVEEEMNVKIEDINKKHQSVLKKLKEEKKALEEKHKATLRNAKDNYKNELVKKNIEFQKEFKKKEDELSVQINNLNQENEIKELQKINSMILLFFKEIYFAFS